MGFLGGILIATLVLVLNAKPMFDVDAPLWGKTYFTTLASWLAVASILSILTAFCNLWGAIYEKTNSRLHRFSLNTARFILVMLLYLIPMLLIPFVSWVIPLAIFVCSSVMWLYVVNVVFRKS